jgi:hypothetical protein
MTDTLNVPANVAGYSSQGQPLPFRCARCGAEACYLVAPHGWLCTDHNIEVHRNLPDDIQ